MLPYVKSLAKTSKSAVVGYQILSDMRAGRRLRAGDIESTCGARHLREPSVSEGVAQIGRIFDDYVGYSGLSAPLLNGRRVLEVGPGDSVGVALRFLAAGARQVVCIDRFLPKQDAVLQREILRALREQLSDGEKALYDKVIRIGDAIEMDPDRLVCLYGIPVEESQAILGSDAFDLVVSCAVIEHLYDTDTALSLLYDSLAPGGCMIHKIDLRDHGMFSSNPRHHPLTFFTVPDSVYKLMSRNRGLPNRKTVAYYRDKMSELGAKSRVLVTHIVGRESELVPYKETVTFGVDYSEQTLSLLRDIRPQLQPEFRDVPAGDLLVSGILLVAAKPANTLTIRLNGERSANQDVA